MQLFPSILIGTLLVSPAVHARALVPVKSLCQSFDCPAHPDLYSGDIFTKAGPAADRRQSWTTVALSVTDIGSAKGVVLPRADVAVDPDVISPEPEVGNGSPIEGGNGLPIPGDTVPPDVGHGLPIPGDITPPQVGHGQPIDPPKPAPPVSPHVAPDGQPSPGTCLRRRGLHQKRCDPPDGGDTDSGSSIGEELGVPPAQEIVTTADPTAILPIDFFQRARDGQLLPVEVEQPGRNVFEQSFQQQKPDVPVPDDAAFDIGYSIEEDVAEPDLATEDDGREEFRQILSDAGIELSPTGHTFGVVSKDPSKDPSDPDHITSDELHRSTYSDDSRVMFADVSKAEFDKNGAETRLPWYKLVAHLIVHKLNHDPRELQVICRSSISNESTKKTIDSIIRATKGLDQTKTIADADPVTVAFDAPEGSIEKAGFDAFMTTDNGRGIYFLLARFRETFGNKEVKKVTVFKIEKGRGAGAAIFIGDRVTEPAVDESNA